MEFIVTQIDEIRYNGELKGYQCFDGTGQSVKVKKGQGGQLQARWGELQVGRAYSFTMGEYNGKPFVKDFEPMSEALAGKMPQPTVTPAIPSVARKPSGEEVGMWWKELGEGLRSGYIKERAMEIAYKAQMLSVLPLEIEKKKTGE